MGTELTTLIECKKYKNPVPREKVELLFNRIRAVGAHKGMLFSTSRFQSGTVQFAKKHGIALVQVIEGKLQYEVRAEHIDEVVIPKWADLPKYCCVNVYKTNTGIGCSFISEKNNEKLIDYMTIKSKN